MAAAVAPLSTWGTPARRSKLYDGGIEDMLEGAAVLDKAPGVSRIPPIRSRQDHAWSPHQPVEVDISTATLAKVARAAIKNHEYETILAELQIELVVLQESLKATGGKVVVIFEGRDAAGKGGCISRISEAMSPRVCRVVAMGTPTAAEKSQWYFQKYVQHLPSAGEMVLFDRSWYNRAGVERVMGFCTDEQYEEFMRSVPLFEEMLVNSGAHVIKLWFDVSDSEQQRRFEKRRVRPACPIHTPERYAHLPLNPAAPCPRRFQLTPL